MLRMRTSAVPLEGAEGGAKVGLLPPLRAADHAEAPVNAALNRGRMYLRRT